MTSIYHDAYLVIAACASASDHGGLLYERPSPTRGKPLESKEGSGVFNLLIQEEVPHAVGLSPAAMVGSPINDRAWCMQELILARRSISFFKEELIWECHSCLDCECGRITSSSHTSQTTNLENFDMTPLWFGWGNPLFGDSFNMIYKWKPYTFFADPETIFNEWRHLTVPAYSARRLSKPEDRLPAAAGIASLIARKYDQEYLAAPYDYIAPSFSWASVNREVMYRCPLPDRYDRVTADGKWLDICDWKSAYGFTEC
ncbi:HET-domain-containing protein [Diaporthe eres]|nr:HET-domain-containing protein [Diaporthe eres]